MSTAVTPLIDHVRAREVSAPGRRGFNEGKFKPVIDPIVPFDKIIEAHRYLEANGQFGKIVATL
jgi:NADPH:quinone reductase-like Zn-dependent oxidoreductase